MFEVFNSLRGAIIEEMRILQGSNHPKHKGEHNAYQIDLVTNQGTWSIHGDHDDGGPTVVDPKGNDHCGETVFPHEPA